MDRDVFLENLMYASNWCREFTTKYVFDELPGNYRFWVRLNRSYDRNLADGEIVFPEDVQKYGRRTGPLSPDDVVSLLWRDGMVPEWIDISVWEADAEKTHFELTCCGRYTADSERLYYRWTDCPPFGVKGPAIPARLALSALDGKPIEKFSLEESRKQAPIGKEETE